MGAREGERRVYHPNAQKNCAQKIDFQPFLTPKLIFNYVFVINEIDCDLFFVFNLQKRNIHMQVRSKKHHVSNMMFENIIFLQLIL